MKKNVFRIFVFSTLALYVHAQETQEQKVDNCKYYYDSSLKERVYTIVSKPALFQNNSCVDELTCFEYYLYDNIGIEKKRTDYNNMWMEHNGRLRFFLIIDTNGDILRIKMLDGKLNEKNKKDYSVLEKETEKIVKKSPKWEPAQCNNKNVIYKKIIFLAKPYLRSDSLSPQKI